MNNYYCNCYELTGKNPELNARYVLTDVCANKICQACGHYAVLGKPERHTAESQRFDWDCLTNVQARLDETELDYYYAEQARQQGKHYVDNGRGRYDRMEIL